jgi:heptosyltransferase-2
MQKKILLIRLSSFGDIVQALRCPAAIHAKNADAQVDWLTKESFASLVEYHPSITTTHKMTNNAGVIDLFFLAKRLRKENYSHIYDAHNNLRSKILFFLLKIYYFRTNCQFLVRPKDRLKRFLLFRFHKNLLPKPFVGQKSFLAPLTIWGITDIPKGKNFFISRYAKDKAASYIKQGKKNIAVMASAAWPSKRWPLEHWQNLLKHSVGNDYHWIFLGGKDDLFIDEMIHSLENLDITNLRGKTNLQESAAIIDAADLVISNDTGLMHVADQLEKKTIAFIGPSAFGYPLSSQVEVFETENLWCKPCSKDGSNRCKNVVYQKCLVDVKPQRVYDRICELLG